MNDSTRRERRTGANGSKKPVESRFMPRTESADLCAGCVACCSYITIEIDPPRQSWEYDQAIWMLHHHGIEMYVEQPEHWFVFVPTRCDQLNVEGRCAIHGRHPVLCRDYDPRDCERRNPLEQPRAWFKTAEELEVWLRENRPAHWRRLEKHRRQMPDAPPVAKGRGARATLAGALVQIRR